MSVMLETRRYCDGPVDVYALGQIDEATFRSLLLADEEIRDLLDEEPPGEWWDVLDEMDEADALSFREALVDEQLLGLKVGLGFIHAHLEPDAETADCMIEWVEVSCDITDCPQRQRVTYVSLGDDLGGIPSHPAEAWTTVPA